MAEDIAHNLDGDPGINLPTRLTLFLRENMPYEPMTSGAVRHRIRHYARMAGISAAVIGAHVFRAGRRSHRKLSVQGMGDTGQQRQFEGHFGFGPTGSQDSGMPVQILQP